MGDWSKFLRENFDKLLLAALFVYGVQVVVHMTHDMRDVDQILWARELAGTIVGALLGLITGHALAAKATTTVTSQPPSATVTTENK